ncbi:hypothetical protein PAHAL_5G061000 [Panicum hallii]|uniref:Leucine-rich repeat-containing N-terminal plant-type domain-containing protein n=2 Tax=Panicum hallii TaxID=206008 RepID=A0A2S3HP64_9POAL|nr:probable inactive receptor kinase At1g27190 isoform X1 [Panicum hallii]PAN27135.1 hypothetical protein PAHAL_5G061000 [Panicum hallii]
MSAWYRAEHWHDRVFMSMDFMIVWLLLILSSLSSCSGTASDVLCLQHLKESLGDPHGALSSWNFSHNATEGHHDICGFTGVECWPDYCKNRVMFLHLGNLGLQGSFPRGLQFCTSITTLNLSVNNLSGPLPADISLQMPWVTHLHLSHNRFSGEIPPDISRRLPFVTFLDLSNNGFSGEIPRTIADLPYLNTLNLQNNQLAGRIPEQIGDLARLKSLNLSNNSLSGPIPGSLRRFAAEDFAGNDGLCGVPLDCKCKKRMRLGLRRVNDASSVGAAVGFVVGFVAAFYSQHWFVFVFSGPASAARACDASEIISV